jgi:hypothetical protein
MGILSGNPKNEPLHYGEVFGIWSFLFTSQACVAAYQTMLNHAGDGDLKELIHEAITASQEEMKEVAELLKENGVGLPPSPPARPVADLESIPAGARFMDNEIAAKISADIAAGLIACSTMMGQAIREDIALLFGKFHGKKAVLGGKFLRLNKEKGWLVPPPLHLQPKED